MSDRQSLQFFEHLRRNDHLLKSGVLNGQPIEQGAVLRAQSRLWEMTDLSASEFAEEASRFVGLERVTLQESSQLDVQGSQAKAGFVGMVANCELEQSALQAVLYDLEASMPFLFIDQLDIQTATATGDSKLRLASPDNGRVQNEPSKTRHPDDRAGAAALCRRVGRDGYVRFVSRRSGRRRGNKSIRSFELERAHDRRGRGDHSACAEQT